jgi:hypothetical protein
MKTTPLTTKHGSISSRADASRYKNLSFAEPAKINVGDVFDQDLTMMLHGRNVQPATLPSSPQRAVRIIVLST